MEREGFTKTGNVSKKTVIILLIILLLLCIGISVFAQSLAGDILKTGTSATATNCDISFTKVVQSSITGNAREIQKVSYNGSSASFYVQLASKNDSITYDFTISNNCSVGMEVKSISLTTSDENNDAILFQTNKLKAGDTLKAGENAEIQVTALYNPNYEGNASNTQKSARIEILFEQI